MKKIIYAPMHECVFKEPYRFEKAKKIFLSDGNERWVEYVIEWPTVILPNKFIEVIDSKLNKLMINTNYIVKIQDCVLVTAVLYSNLNSNELIAEQQKGYYKYFYEFSAGTNNEDVEFNNMCNRNVEIQPIDYEYIGKEL